EATELVAAGRHRQPAAPLPCRQAARSARQRMQRPGKEVGERARSQHGHHERQRTGAERRPADLSERLERDRLEATVACAGWSLAIDRTAWLCRRRQVTLNGSHGSDRRPRRQRHRTECHDGERDRQAPPQARAATPAMPPPAMATVPAASVDPRRRLVAATRLVLPWWATAAWPLATPVHLSALSR